MQANGAPAPPPPLCGLLESYVFWNNKGGVGKSTLTFNVAAGFAYRNPGIDVVVIDADPQGSVSTSFLGGLTLQGAEKLEELVLEPSGVADPPRTIVGLLREAAPSNERGGHLLPNAVGRFSITPSKYTVRVDGELQERSNPHIPPNVHLVCGDPNLEIISPLLNGWAHNAHDMPGERSMWIRTHLMLKKFLDQLRQDQQRRWVVFIDTNPSFNIYTTIALSAAGKLLVPVMADTYSRIATRTMLHLIYGTDEPHQLWDKFSYASKANAEQLERPKILMIVGNQIGQHNNGPKRAFEQSVKGTAAEVKESFDRHPERFVEPPPGTPAEDFEWLWYQVLNFNTPGIVSLHTGKPLHVIALVGGASERVENLGGSEPVRFNYTVARKPWFDGILGLLKLIERDSGLSHGDHAVDGRATPASAPNRHSKRQRTNGRN